MIVVMKPRSNDKQIQHVLKKIKEQGFKTHLSKGVETTIIGVIGDERKLQKEQLEVLDGVEKVMPVLKPYKLASRDFHPEDTIFKLNGIKIGGKKIVVIAGPCAVESEKQIIGIAKAVKKKGATVLRGGAFKPRTSPYSFQGLGEEGLKMLAKAREETGLLVVTEVMDTRQVVLVSKYCDILQIGARNMQNFDLLKEVGKTDKPVLLKRGISATLNEFLMSAEYIMSQGNDKVILCERGIRSFDNYTRNCLDLSIVPAIKKLTHLPIIVDPSHATGKWELVNAMSKAAIAAGADGLLVEVHTNPENSAVDADQTISTKNFAKLMKELRLLTKAVGRSM